MFAEGLLFGGWEVAPIWTARTGGPFSLFDCSNALQVCPHAFFDGHPPSSGVTNVPAPGVPNSFDYYDLSKVKVNSDYVNKKVNVSDFGPFPSNFSGRNAFRAQGTWNVDLGVYKNFALTERFKLQLRGEAYNMFNHANYFVSLGDNDVSSIDFVSARRA